MQFGSRQSECDGGMRGSKEWFTVEGWAQSAYSESKSVGQKERDKRDKAKGGAKSHDGRKTHRPESD